jgi:hypothetical protein
MEEPAAILLLTISNPSALDKIMLAAADAESYAYQTYGETPKADAFRHAYWTANSVSDVWVSKADIDMISTAHEYTNRANKQQAFNSTMDLHNNAVGSTINLSNWGLSDLPAIRATILQKYENGDLRIWIGEGEQQDSEGVLIKSNGEKIFPN